MRLIPAYADLGCTCSSSALVCPHLQPKSVLQRPLCTVNVPGGIDQAAVRKKSAAWIMADVVVSPDVFGVARCGGGVDARRNLICLRQPPTETLARAVESLLLRFDRKHVPAAISFCNVRLRGYYAA